MSYGMTAHKIIPHLLIAKSGKIFYSITKEPVKDSIFDGKEKHTDIKQVIGMPRAQTK